MSGSGKNAGEDAPSSRSARNTGAAASLLLATAVMSVVSVLLLVGGAAAGCESYRLEVACREGVVRLECESRGVASADCGRLAVERCKGGALSKAQWVSIRLGLAGLAFSVLLGFAWIAIRLASTRGTMSRAALAATCLVLLVAIGTKAIEIWVDAPTGRLEAFCRGTTVGDEQGRVAARAEQPGFAVRLSDTPRGRVLRVSVHSNLPPDRHLCDVQLEGGKVVSKIFYRD